MSAVLITGMSCAGKSTIAAVLTRRGLAAIDSDNDPLLARSVDSAGHVVDEPAAPDFAWLARHSWSWNPARLDEVIRAAATCAAGCPNTRTGCAPPGRSLSTPRSPSTTWWTRYSPARAHRLAVMMTVVQWSRQTAQPKADRAHDVGGGQVRGSVTVPGRWLNVVIVNHSSSCGS